MAAPYSDAQLQAFWYGGTPDNPGSETNILPNAFVLMTNPQIILLTTPGNPSYNADYANYLPGAAEEEPLGAGHFFFHRRFRMTGTIQSLKNGFGFINQEGTEKLW